MPFNGSGIYSAPSLPGSWNPAVSGSTASPTDWNQLLADFSAAFSTALLKDGTQTVTADIPFNAHKLTGVANGTNPQDVTTLTQVEALIAAAVSAARTPTGVVDDYIGATAPTGWVLAVGTIGDASSGASTRANADCETLFTLLWNDWANTQAPVSGGRGANAAADWAAHKTIGIPDLRGRVRAGKDNMGGSAAGRLTGATISPDGNTLGASGGAQTVTLGQGEMPVHSHGVTDPGHNHATNADNVSLGSSGGGNALWQSPAGGNPVTSGVSVTNITIQNAGSGAAHNNVQSTMIFTVIVKL